MSLDVDDSYMATRHYRALQIAAGCSARCK